MPKYNVGIDVGMGGAIAILEKEQVPAKNEYLKQLIFTICQKSTTSAI